MSHAPKDLLPFKSESPWMQSLAVVNERGARHLSMLYQWERSQWAAPDALRRHMLGQMDHLVRAAFRHTQHYKKTLSQINYNPSLPLSEERWSNIPVLTRSEIQTRTKQLTATTIPKSQQATKKVNSSGSTGRPIEVLVPAIRGMLWSSATLFEHILHDRDFLAKAAAIRVVKNGSVQRGGKNGSSWGTPFTDLFKTGPSTLFDIHQDPERQADWLIREDPAYLLCFPSSLEALLPILKDKKADLPGLHHFRTMSEQLPPALREDAYSLFGKKIVDMYSAQEVGYIALQCPKHDHYHLFQDICFTEILRDDNTPCVPGEIGRIVVTDPFNLAFPLIRYDIGDYAEVGEPCDCGRGQQTIKRVMGRVRNLITLPDGSRHWPLTSSRRFREIANISQFQLLQTSLSSIEAKFVCDHPLTLENKTLLVAIIQDRLTYPFDVTINQVNEIPRGANGKYEEFKSEVTPEMAAAARREHGMA